ncbi:hypothetical protein ACFOS2_14905 [Bacillus chungangensis]|uniref:Positive regulator of sigma E activity n=1 Tax=Bacillus chungangensis TaxID=587633 RepID=A0ABT9WQK1_9BACI|nr:hypothetical protein [Bacillus chungangensis]MDQ0175499.1 positive regulator of sigma E activity [Bacillus chungangensis]
MKIFLNKNFSFMFFGRVISNIGDSLYTVAAMWLVYDLGGSTFYTGLAGFLTILPRFIQFISGPLIDRLPIRPLLIITQSIQSILLLFIPIAHYSKHLLGRVFSASFSLSGTAMPIGSLIGGSLGVMIGSIFVISLSGIVVFLVGIFWVVDKTTRSLPKTEDITESTFVKQFSSLEVN